CQRGTRTWNGPEPPARASSVREQDGDFRVLEQAAGDAAEHLLARARVAVSAGDQQLRPDLARPAQDGLAGTRAFARQRRYLHSQAMAREVRGDVGARQFAMTDLADPRIHDH